ncbi:hypothetical protein NKH77_23930 [Streptomyces sp. M19]
MTVAFFSRGARSKARRAAAAAGAVSLGLVALAACDKPTPMATVTVGSDSVHVEATDGCYNDGKALKKKASNNCFNEKADKTITVDPGERVRIGVDPEIADSGWAVVGASTVMNAPSKSTYRTFDSDALFEQKDPQSGQVVGAAKKVTLVIIEFSNGTTAKGMWHVNLKQGTPDRVRPAGGRPARPRRDGRGRRAGRGAARRRRYGR